MQSVQWLTLALHTFALRMVKKHMGQLRMSSGRLLASESLRISAHNNTGKRKQDEENNTIFTIRFLMGFGENYADYEECSLREMQKFKEIPNRQ
jgi:hypothetical protein